MTKEELEKQEQELKDKIELEDRKEKIRKLHTQLKEKENQNKPSRRIFRGLGKLIKKGYDKI